MAPPPPVSAAPVESAPAVIHTMSLQHYEYVFDWAAILHISPTNPLDEEARGLRCLAIPKGFSTQIKAR
eukprot:1047530-Pleurochrysis_carterae.AAC.1